MATENDFYSCCIDEIALEGLDGITLQAFWVRLRRRPNFPLSLDDNSKAFIWRNLVPESRLRFYALKEPRMDLVIYERYQNVDPNTGYVIEPAVLPPDTYPIQIVNKDGQRGSCTTFYTREDISDSIRQSCPKLDEVMATWGNRLVIVADQLTREQALVGPCNSTKDLNLTDNKYCILERIGRSRYLGQTTQGAQDLRVFNLTHASMFVMRKQLVQRNLITKQDFVLTCENGGSKIGFLLHLPRFFVEIKTKSQVLLKELCALLETKPNKREVSTKLFSELGMCPAAFKKLITASSCKYLQRCSMPFKDYYPDSTPDQWYTQNNNKMRTVRFVQLVQSYDEDDVEDDTEENLDDKSACLIFEPKKYIYDRPRLDQAFREVYNSGTAGMTQRELATSMLTTRLEIRNLQKGLITQKVVVPYKEDVGKQRVIRYFCPEFATKSDVHEKFAAEKKRLLEQPRAEPPAAKRQKKTATPGIPENQPEQREAAEPAGEVEQVELVECSGKDETKEATMTESSTASEALGVQEESKEAKESKDNSTLSTPAVSLLNESGATSASEPLNVSVETYSDCWFQKVNPTSHISFPGSSDFVNRRSLQRMLPSYGMLKRANRILEYVRSEKLVSNITKLLKVLQKVEKDEGSTMKLDKVSLERLLYKLCKGGYLKSFRIVMRLGDRVKELRFIGLPNMTMEDNIVKMSVEQAKFKYFSAQREPTKSENNSSRSSPAPETECAKMVYSPAMGRYNGSQPKFRKMHLCYVFMHYLLYTYDGVPQEPSPDDPLSPVQYQKEVSWKMFIPPLTKSPSTPEGWVLFGDMLLSLPLSLFVKISTVRHKIEGLEEYLNDKVRSHYLIRSLPAKLRNALLFARRYIYTIHETVKRLAYVGMLTFGPHRLKEKDQVFLYLHRNLCIKDTTVSRPGYHQISTDVSYPMRHYFLETELDVNQFWLEVENICLCTPLGTAHSQQGQVIELQNLYHKPAMIEACRNREFGEEQDDATVPGDQLGAAGFDSALFAHLKRNWVYPSQVSGKPGLNFAQSEKGTSKNAKPLQKILSYLDRASKDTGSGNLPKQNRRAQTISRISVYYPKDPNSAPLAVPVVKGADKAGCEQQPKKKTLARKKCESITRVLKPRKRSAVRKPYYDDKDQAALKEMKTMRVTWTSQEDIVLLMCKVSSWFLDRHLDKMVVPFSVIRDVLNERFPSLSKDKTSRACQRRLRFMLLNPATKANASVFFCEALQDQTLVEMFHGPKPVKSDEKQWESMFRTVLDHLMIKFSKSSEERHQAITLPSTVEELKKHYDIVVSGRAESESWSYSEPHNIVDIHFISVAMVILASLAADDGKTNWALILYKIYEQYPDKLVRSVTARLRHNGVISRKPRHAKKLYISLNLPMLPFVLSGRFKYEMTRRFTPAHFTEMSKFLLDFLARHRNGKAYTFDSCIEPVYVPLLMTLQLMNKLTYDMEVPQAIIDFDSGLLSGWTMRRKAPAALTDSSFGEELTLSDKAKSLNFDAAGSNAKTSRSFLYMLRQDMTKALQYNCTRPQDCAIIKSCRLDFSLVDEDLVPGWTVEEPKDKSYSLKIRNPLYDKIVCQQRACHPVNLCDTSWTAEGLANLYMLEGQTQEDAQVGTEIYYFILKREQLGAPYSDLSNTFHSVMSSATLDFHLAFLVSKNTIMQVGATCIRYVAVQRCKPWVVRSFKIPKDMKAYASALGEQEHVLRAKMRKMAAPDVGDEAEKAAEIGMDVADRSYHTAENEPNSSLRVPSTSHAESAEKQDSGTSSAGTDVASRGLTGKAPTTRRTRDSNSCSLKRTYYEAMTKNINIESLEKIMYIPRLWRKPDGTLNRPIFLQYLSVVLTHVMDHPGVTEDYFRNGFSRQIEPCVQTLDLLKILEQLGCIRRFFMQRSSTAKCSLFSKRPPIVIRDEYHPGDIVCFEGTMEALVNFAAFTAYFVK